MEDLGLKMSNREQKCRSCGGILAVTFADLGASPPSNSNLRLADQIATEKSYPLCAKVCEDCFLVQLNYDVPPAELFANYTYFSSFSDSWLEHARRYCEMARTRFGLGPNSLVVELASNDGYLLKNFLDAGVPVLGIDPSDTVARSAEKIGVPTLVEFFGVQVANTLKPQGRQADLIIGNNVLAHVPALNDFVAGIAILLKPQGRVTIEFPHLVKLIEHVEFDTIYHEHFSYLSLMAIEKVFARHALKIFDVEELPTHGGSLRIFAAHKGDGSVVESAGLHKVRADEAEAGLEKLSTYESFSHKVEECRKSLHAFLAKAKAEGKTVAAYGAAAKGNTLLNFSGVTTAQIPFVADRNPNKQNTLCPGTHIPVVTPETLMLAKPDYVLILPWNLRDEIVSQLDGIRAWGGQFVTPVPLVKVF